jgi:hypothetical protein
MKKLSFFFIAIILFAACKKSSTTDIVTPPVIVLGPKIKTDSSTRNGVNKYTYDAQGRVIVANYGLPNREEYSYSTNTVSTKYYNAQGNVDGTQLFDLNSDGLITTSTLTAPPPSYVKEVYKYNVDKQLATKFLSVPGITNASVDSNFYTGKNIDSIHRSYSANNDLTYLYYTYYTDKLNTIGVKNSGNLYYAEPFYNAVKQIQYRLKTNNVYNTIIQDFSYSYDAEGRIIKRVTLQNGNPYNENYYTYY